MLVDISQIVVFTLHLIAVDVAAVAPLFCIALAWRAARRDDAAADALGRRLAVWCSLALAIGIVLGLVNGLLIWVAGGAEFFTALRQIPTERLWFGVLELAFYFACMIPYAWFWVWGKRHPLWHGLIALVAATNLLYHFPTLFAVVTVVSTRPDLWGQEHRFVSLMLSPEPAARILHQIAAAVIVCGAAVMALALRLPRRGFSEADSSRLGYWPARVALIAAVTQVPLGMLLLFRMQSTSQRALMGGNVLATGSFALGVLAAVGLIHMLATASAVDAERKTVVRCVLLAVAVILLMTATRHWSRRAIYERISTEQAVTTEISRLTRENAG